MEERKMQKVYGLIRRLGISKKYKGYKYLADAVVLVMEMEDEPIRITKVIYPELARKYHVTPEAIEQNIRTVVGQCWGRNRSLIEHLAGFRLSERPTNMELIEILAFYLAARSKKKFSIA